MSQAFSNGDFLVFQLEAGFALLRFLDSDENAFHVRAYGDLFADVESAEAAANTPNELTVSIPHVALSQRAFESTQVAIIANAKLNANELTALNAWRDNPKREIEDRSIRLLLGLR